MLIALVALAFGMLIGSFLNVCIYRLPRDLSVISPARSFCPECGETVAWYDNVPLVSYLVLGGRCRQCAKPIPLRYLLVEALTGTLFFVFVLLLGPTAAALKWCLFGALVTGLMFSDFEERILPDEFTIGGLVLGLALAFFVPFRGELVLGYFVSLYVSARWVAPVEAAVSALVPALIMWGLAWVYLRVRRREGLGLGDVKMIAMIGAFLGLEGTIYAIMIGSVLGSVIGLAYIHLTHKDASSYWLPFGTFLGIGALATALLEAFWLSKATG